MTDLRTAAQQALEALELAHLNGRSKLRRQKLVDSIDALRAALAQPDPVMCSNTFACRCPKHFTALKAEPTVTEDMKSAVRWAPSSAYWSQRLREFFGPEAREGIDALERRLAKTQQAEPLNLSDPAVQKRLASQWGYVPAAQAEPVAWRCACGANLYLDEYGHPASRAAPRYGKPQQAEPVEPVGAAGLFTLAHLWAQQCYFKGLGRPCDIDSARGAFEQALKAYTAPPQRKPLTEEEIMHIGMTHQSLRQVARAIERAHGIKE